MRGKEEKLIMLGGDEVRVPPKWVEGPFLDRFTGLSPTTDRAGLGVYYWRGGLGHMTSSCRSQVSLFMIIIRLAKAGLSTGRWPLWHPRQQSPGASFSALTSPFSPMPSKAGSVLRAKTQALLVKAPAFPFFL